MTSAWHDIYTDGRRLEKIIRFCETMIFKKDIDEQLKLSYIDRMIKTTRQKVEIVDKVLGVEHFDSAIEAEKHRFGRHYDYLLAQVNGQKEVLRDFMVNFESRWKKYLNS